jgi:hypothetical protein
MGDGRQRDPEGLADVPHAAAGMRGHVEQHLALRVREVELGGALPEELAEDRVTERVQEVEELLRLRGPLPAARAVASRSHRTMVHPLNSLVN